LTEELALRDAYLRETGAVVVEAGDGGVTLDRTVFYARGGGQPGDTGSLSWDGGSVQVTDTVRREGAVLHLCDGALPSAGTPVRACIDWDRRYLLMRTHTALHVLSAVVWSGFGAKVTGGNMEPGRARMDFELAGMSADFGREVEARLAAALAGNHTVTVMFLPRSQALADPDLIRTKVSLLPGSVDPVRIVDIAGIDRQADGGTHVASTGEVGEVRVVGTESKGRGNKRMRIELTG